MIKKTKQDVFSIYYLLKVINQFKVIESNFNKGYTYQTIWKIPANLKFGFPDSAEAASSTILRDQKKKREREKDVKTGQVLETARMCAHVLL